MRSFEEYVLEFNDKDQEIIVFVTTGFGGATMISEFFCIVSYFPAMVDPTNNQLIEEDGRIELLVSKENYKNNTYSKMSDNGIYRLLVAKSIPKELTSDILPSINNRFLLKRVLESYESVQAPMSLLSYREEYLKHVSINVNGIEFALNKKMRWYEGCVSVLGINCSVMLCLDKGSKREAVSSVGRYKSIIGKITDLDQKIKNRCANEYIELVNEWKGSDSDPDITKEEFIQKLTLEEIVFRTDKTAEFTYNDGFLFGGHEILVRVDCNDIIVSCDLV